jgi:2-polyprenyl-6-methoxyphenol hydroxylase-like FAD-dependent oxidoreductase
MLSAVGLRRAGIDVTLFEAAVGDKSSFNAIYLAQNISQAKFGEVGAGVAFGTSLGSNSNTPMLTFTCM